MDFGAVVVDWIFGQESDLVLVEQLDLPAGGLELLEGVLAAEVLANEDLEAVLDLGLLGGRDVAADPRSADQHHEGHF